MLKPTVHNLTFDFTNHSASICARCSLSSGCQTAPVLNVPVKNCTYFADVMKYWDGKEGHRANRLREAFF
jgi:hypothetical protein